jgi:cyclic beta-1,2-glucan synthetase
MPEALAFDNEYGGMTSDGEYVVRVRGDQLPPAPWSNVVANPHGGFLVTERGGGFTWAGSSYAFRLTPWRNDPVSDLPGEALYLRDDDSGAVWSATPAPIRSRASYRVRHGAGYSSFDLERGGIATTLTLAMAEDEAVRISLLRLTNLGSRPRHITLTAYVEWTLGTLRKRARHHVRTWMEPEQAAMFAQNRFDPEFADWVAFCALSQPLTAHTGDRREFLGRNGTAGSPAGLRRTLAGTTGAALDPCAALQCALELAPGESRDVVVLLGAAPDERRAREAVATLRDVGQATAALEDSVKLWRERLETIAVHTPEPSFDAMVNRWALYQALSSRMWGRAALYQNSGAYGFRDQLQDVMAFVHAEPGVAREHILRAAARQFVEGDVQHWWHPQSGRGVRTRFADDLAWLPYVVEHYVRVTGDAPILDEPVSFLHMRALGPDEHEAYDLPPVTGMAALYDHCTLALRRACTAGKHGLPLIGTGDWNDGMNRVGAAGRGESVWLGWFLVATLRAFAGMARGRGDGATASWCQDRADAYTAAVEANGWDGEWYRRAYFDDGAALGSAGDEECRIDAIAQSWSVLSGAGEPARQLRAMAALERELVREREGIIQLLTPPFASGPRDPGYIKGYLPGVRENGAQYTHAALWAVAATARLGRGDRAFQLFQMLNPLQHSLTREQVDTYRVEPYVVAADVYTAPGLLGRGGWTWYTGSASWMYRVALEEILGFTRQGDRLAIHPRVPAAWPEFTIDYRYGTSRYSIRVMNPGALDGAPKEVSVDGRTLSDDWIPLLDDGAPHVVLVRTAAPADADR